MAFLSELAPVTIVLPEGLVGSTKVLACTVVMQNIIPTSRVSCLTSIYIPMKAWLVLSVYISSSTLAFG